MTVDFQTDTVIVKSGTGVTTLTIRRRDGGCIAVDYTAVRKSQFGSSQYFGVLCG